VKVGEDVIISPQAIIVRPELVTMGDHNAIDAFTFISTALEMGSYIHISPHCSIVGGARSKLIMGDFSGLSAGCRIVCGTDSYKGDALTNPVVPQQYRLITYTTVALERFVVLGTNVVVHPGVTIGEGAVVGSCSLVTKDLAPWGIYYGVPARWAGLRKQDAVRKYAQELMG
jgi:acetyltransferase-like isoleucine patch superfamily enzyme